MLTKLICTVRSALSYALALLATAAVAQTTINVGPGRTYTTIQSGINAAVNGDTVLVDPGTYNENINFNGKAITVTSSGGAASTIIDGGQTAPAVVFVTSETRASVLSGFTIQHGGVLTYLDWVNGGIYLSGSAPSILNNILTQNNCWTIYSYWSAPLIKSNEINSTHDPNGNCSFGGGAGIYIGGNLNGTIATTLGNSAVIVGNQIENNVESGLEDAGGNGGAGIAVWGGSPVIMYNTIRDNSSPGGSGGAINLQGGAGVAVIENLIYGNSAGCGGGAIADQTNVDPRTGVSSLVANNTMADNTGDDLGGYSECISIAQIYPSPDTYGTGNTGMMYINNIISGNTSYPAVDCSWFNTPVPANQPTFENNILYNAGGPFFGSYCVDVSDQDNNIASDPQFLNPGADFHLKGTSPAIDSGQNSVLQTFQTMTGMAWTLDAGGNPRVQDATGKGCIIDMGAYEYAGTACGDIVTETLNSSLNPAMAGQTVTFTAQLTASSGTPTGTVQFIDGANPLSTQTASSTGSATYSTSTLTVGNHTITANFQPTGTFSASSASLNQMINGVATSTALTCLPNPIDIDNTAQLTATVSSTSGTPTGSISFTDNGTALATNNLVGGSTSLTYTGAVVATHNIVATYTPTGPFTGSSATCPEVVNVLPTTSTLSVSPGIATYGAPVTLTAIVAPATPPGPSTPTGTVTFFNGATAIGTGTLSGGVATLVTSSLSGGNHSLTCMYGGSSIYAASDCNSVLAPINPAPTALTITSSINPAQYLTRVVFTARLTVNGQSAGAGNPIHFSLNGQSANVTTDSTGSATAATSTLPTGDDAVAASIADSNDYFASSISLVQVITAIPTSISLTATPNPGDLNQPVTLTATVAPQNAPTQAAGGTVTFYDGSTSLGTAQLSPVDVASITTSFSIVGVHSLTAVYAGNPNATGSTSAVFAEMIQAGDFSISAKPGVATVYTGISTAVVVSVSSLRGFNQSLALTCAGLPANSTCSFSPASLPQGQGDANLVIQTTAPQKTEAGFVSGTKPGFEAVIGALTLLLLPGRKRRRRLMAGLSAILLAVVIEMGMAGCGSPNPVFGGTPPGTYQVAVTAATSGAGPALTHSAVVTLTVKSLF